MTDHTLTTAFVRQAYSTAWDHVTPPVDVELVREQAQIEFDRWLNEEIRKAERRGKLTGWSEGYEHGKKDERLAAALQVGIDLGGYATPNRSNPYEEES